MPLEWLSDRPHHECDDVVRDSMACHRFTRVQSQHVCLPKCTLSAHGGFFGVPSVETSVMGMIFRGLVIKIDVTFVNAKGERFKPIR